MLQYTYIGIKGISWQKGQSHRVVDILKFGEMLLVDESLQPYHSVVVTLPGEQVTWICTVLLRAVFQKCPNLDFFTFFCTNILDNLFNTVQSFYVITKL